MLTAKNNFNALGILRILLLVGLAVVGYLLLLEWKKDYHNQSIEPAPIANTPTITPETDIPAAPVTAEQAGDLPQVSPPQLEPVPSGTQQAESIVEINTDVFNLIINLNGGDIQYAALTQYPATVEDQDKPFVLLNNRQHVYIAQSGVLGVSGKDLDQSDRPLYSVDRTEFNLQGDVLEVPLHFSLNGIQVTKLYRFYRGEYRIDVEYLFENHSQAHWSGKFFAQLKRDGAPDPSADSTGMALPTYLGAAYWKPDEKYNKLKFKTIAESAEEGRYALNETMMGGWAAIVQHYFMSAWIPDSDRTYVYNARQNKAGQYIIGLVSKEGFSVAPGQQKTLSAQLYVGPKIQENLENLSDGLHLAVDYGFLFFISHLLFVTLKWIHALVGNWGWSIVILTLLVKALFYYPSAISYRSMAHMRRLQPEMVRIKELYGSDRQKLSQEMMKLYQKEKINPLGGCLPMLLQMPVFIALYWTLLESVELRHAEFIFWIKDLSVMDPYFVLPLLMGVSMFVQTHLNPEPPDPTQAKVMKIMPVLFTVFFLFFPAGLVLYWLTNNILSITQQWLITRSIEKQT